MNADELHGWNEARHIASRLLQAVEEDTYENAVSDLPYTVPTYDEIIEVRDAAESGSDAVNTLAHKVRDTANRETATESNDASNSPSGNTLDQWNDARRLATRLLDTVEAGEHTYSELSAEYGELTFPSEARVADKVSEVTGTRTERINEIARWVRTWNGSETAEESERSRSVTGWNDARSLASQLLDVVDGGDYNAVVSEYEAMNFPPEERIVEWVSELSGSRTERLNETARWILDWDESGWDREESESPQETSGETDAEEATNNNDAAALTQWNDARQLATQLLDAVEGGEYDAVVSDYGHIEFPPEPHARHKISEFTGSRTERINEIARWVLDWGETDWDGVTLEYADSDAGDAEEGESKREGTADTGESQDVPTEDLSEREQVAADILKNFRNHEGRYGEIIREYSQLDLPPQPEMMMAVHRTTGMDDSEAIQTLSDVIGEWETTSAGTDDGHPRSQYVYGRASKRT